MKEKKNVKMVDVQYGLNSLGRPMARGKCPRDGTSMSKMISLSDAPKNIQEEAAKFKKSPSAGKRSSKKSRKSKNGGRPSRKSGRAAHKPRK